MIEMLQNFTYWLLENISAWPIILLLCTLLVIWQYKKPHPNFPPGPKGLPILGSILQLRKGPEKVIKKWSIEKYGPVMSVVMRNERVVYLNSYEAIAAAFLKQGSKFSGRPSIPLFHQVTQDYGLVMKDYSDSYKIQRKFGNKILRSFGFGQKKMEDIINREGSYLLEHLRHKTGKPVDIKTDIYNVTANIISAVALGRRFQYDDATFHQILLSTEKSFGDVDDAMYMLIIVMLPWLRLFPPFRQANQRFIKNQHTILGLLKEIIKEHKEKFDPENLEDFIDAYLYEQEFGAGKDNRQFEDKQLEVFLRDLFFAGTETSSNTISWVLLLLLHYPQHMKKVEEEIEATIGKDGTPSTEHKPNMPFTSAFLQETMRFRTLTPGGSPHLTTENANLYDYYIPKGTMVMANLWGVNNDPETWKNPEKFDPYRHINEEGSFVHSPKVLPFSIGPRVCLGEHLARMEIFLLVVNLLQKFKISKDPSTDGLPSLMEGVTSLICTPTRYKILLEER